MSTTGEVLEAFHDVSAALKAPDPKALDSLIAEDYRGFDLRGYVEEREAILDFYRPGHARMEEFEVNDLRTHVSATLGVVTGLGTLTGLYRGDRFKHVVRFCNIFVHRNSRWQLLFTQSTEVEPGDRF